MLPSANIWCAVAPGRTSALFYVLDKGGLRRSIPEQLAAQQEAAYAEEEETGPPLGTQKQYLLVMRHGERLDEVDVGWREKAERPWDPPLSPKGEQQVGRRCSTARHDNAWC